MKFVINRILRMDYKRLFTVVKRIHKKTGKNSIYLFFDIVICGLKYKAGYLDYELFEMYDLNKKQRKTVLTRGINNDFVRKYNVKGYRDLFNNKWNFDNKFKKFMKRDFMLLDENNEKEFNEFCKGKEYIIAKPLEGTHGDGIMKIKPDKNTYKKLIKTESRLIEDYIIQDKAMDKMNPSSINTLRIVTLYDQGVSTIICTYLRVGNNKIVDNFNNGGMVVPINTDTGIIEYNAIDKAGHVFEKHPETGTKFIGFKVPQFEEAKKFCLEASKVIKEVGYVGWDVGISNKGPCLIEGNDYPGHDIYQLPIHRTNGIGVLPDFLKRMERKK